MPHTLGLVPGKGSGLAALGLGPCWPGRQTRLTRSLFSFLGFIERTPPFPPLLVRRRLWPAAVRS